MLGGDVVVFFFPSPGLCKKAVLINGLSKQQRMKKSARTATQGILLILHSIFLEGSDVGVCDFSWPALFLHDYVNDQQAETGVASCRALGFLPISSAGTLRSGACRGNFIPFS